MLKLERCFGFLFLQGEYQTQSSAQNLLKLYQKSKLVYGRQRFFPNYTQDKKKNMHRNRVKRLANASPGLQVSGSLWCTKFSLCQSRICSTVGGSNFAFVSVLMWLTQRFCYIDRCLNYASIAKAFSWLSMLKLSGFFFLPKRRTVMWFITSLIISKVVSKK